MGTQVVAPDGTSWEVGRRWLPRPPRWVGKGFSNLLRRDGDVPAAPRLDDGADTRRDRSAWWEAIAGVSGAGDVAGEPAALIVVAFVIVAVLAFLFVLPALVFVVDVVLVLSLAALAVAARILFRRPWVVVAHRDDITYEWAVVGWKASNRAIERVKRTIVRGQSLDDVRLRLL